MICLDRKTPAALILAIVLAFPSAAQALSCMPAADMLEQYATESGYQIMTAEVVAEKNFITKRKGETDMYDAGNQGQLLAVSDVHRGTVVEQEWVYFNRDATWGYMCTSAPPEIGTESLYVVRTPDSVLRLNSVVDVFPVDAELAQELLLLIESDEQEIVGPSPATRAEMLANELRSMIHVMRIKLSEWRFWNSQ